MILLQYLTNCVMQISWSENTPQPFLSSRRQARASTRGGTLRRQDKSAVEFELDSAPADGKQPIYRQIAAQLRQADHGRSLSVGARLPTELELCEQFGISRFTARGAVRLLLTEGLVTRRPRVGTVVIALPGDARYSHDVTAVHDSLRYPPGHGTASRLHRQDCASQGVGARVLRGTWQGIDLLHGYW